MASALAASPMNIVIFELAHPGSKLAAPMACVNPDSLERLQAAPCVYVRATGVRRSASCSTCPTGADLAPWQAPGAVLRAMISFTFWPISLSA